MYVPGETKDLDDVRKIMIEHGGLITILFLIKKEEIG